MTFTAFWAIIKGMGAVAGAIITMATLFGLISKKPRAAFRKVIREESENANKDIKAELSEIKDDLSYAKENDLAILRNTITHIYFKYKDQRKIPHYEKENVMSLYERYDALKGNHYIHTIVGEMETWEEII